MSAYAFSPTRPVRLRLRVSSEGRAPRAEQPPRVTAASALAFGGGAENPAEPKPDDGPAWVNRHPPTSEICGYPCFSVDNRRGNSGGRGATSAIAGSGWRRVDGKSGSCRRESWLGERSRLRVSVHQHDVSHRSSLSHHTAAAPLRSNLRWCNRPRRRGSLERPAVTLRPRTRGSPARPPRHR